ncbi:MAG: class I SAM-dependent methyltransferase [Acidobacteriaceae bacterium]|nr:class I SAM-dependent methyltransferase [Acidobacteriaceae bacterium]
MARDEQRIIREIIRAYDGLAVRVYCALRFQILNQQFLREIGQYLPKSGRVLDIGCGFGLFSLYYARVNPKLEIVGIDRNAARIERARRAAERLGIRNVHYEVGDVTTYPIREAFDGAYMLDIIHHIPPAEVEPLIRRVIECLSPRSRFMIKDIDSKPAYKRWFTWVLDKLMDPSTPVHYWPRTELIALTESAGLEVFNHTIKDYLPYPHILYICQPACAEPVTAPQRKLARAR